MGKSPQWKVYSVVREYVAATRYPEDAAALASVNGRGTEVRYGHKMVVWREGSEDFSAGESYDRAAEVMVARSRGLVP